MNQKRGRSSLKNKRNMPGIRGLLGVILVLLLAGNCILQVQNRQEMADLKMRVTAVEKDVLDNRKDLLAKEKKEEGKVAALSKAQEEPKLKEEAKPAEEPPVPDKAEAAPVLSLDAIEPGTILTAEQVGDAVYDLFKTYPIEVGDEVYNRINGKSYRENSNIQLSDLRYLKMLHYNFDGKIQVGEMVVNAAISEDVLGVFKELFAVQYQVQSMYLIDNYWTGDANTTDTASIDQNNTSCFNYRVVTGGSNLSNHAYGRAIDINPQQNPYVSYRNGQADWSHSNSDEYVFNREESADPHVIKAGDVCYNIFIRYGFSWGGLWTSTVDYQHFEKEA
jgi:hypothetical protein